MSGKPISPRLGRGLASLLGDATAPAAPGAANAVRDIAVADLEPGPFQPRRDMGEAALTELANSIRERGVLQPILARPHPRRPDQYQIIAGERRWRAAQAAGLHEIPALIRPLSDRDAMAASLVENLQRQDLNPIEEALGYQRLLSEFGLSHEQLGEAVGKSRSHVTNMLRLLQLPPTVRVEVEKGALSVGHARALLGHPDPERAALAVIAQGLNVRQTEDLAQARASAPANGPAKDGAVAGEASQSETAAMERDLSERLGLAVRIRFDGHGGAVHIRYRSLDQLDGLITLLTRD